MAQNSMTNTLEYVATLLNLAEHIDTGQFFCWVALCPS